MSEKFTPFGENPKEIILGGIESFLEEKQFHLNEEQRATLVDQVSRRRFAYLVAERNEGDQKVERFLKIPVVDDELLDANLARQVELGKFLKADGRIKTRGIIDANADRSKGIPFLIMETFGKEEAKIGFILTREGKNLLGIREAESCIETLESLQSIDVSSLPQTVRDALPNFGVTADKFFKSLINILNQEVVTFDAPSGKKERYFEVLNRRFNITNFTEKVLELINAAEDLLNKEDGHPVLRHGDTAPHNLFVHDNGEVEFLDWELASVCDNGAVAMIKDYGYLRVYMWANKEFQEALDKKLLELYNNRGEEALGKVIIALGILRAHMEIAGFFENYPVEKQRKEYENRRREVTEADIPKAWEILGLKF